MPKTVRDRLKNFAARIFFKLTGSALSQKENAHLAVGATVPAETSALLRRAAAEGAVLLKNDGTLPLKGKFALFGRVQTDTFFTGYGSGGDVVRPYAISISEGLERGHAPLVSCVKEFYAKWREKNVAPKGSWGNWPYSYPEAELPAPLLAQAASETDTAVVVLGRAAGEDRENELCEGSFYLTKRERKLLEDVTGRFSRVAVVLNIGNIIDFSWVEEYPIGALLLIWQGGMETGNACADLLLGKRSPCGKLPACIARKYEDHPAQNFGDAAYSEYAEDVYLGYRYFETFAKERVLFPFGFGLGYTQFEMKASLSENTLKYCVKNVGEASGREVVEVFVERPQGDLGNPARVLAAFKKTALLAPGEEEAGEIELPVRALCTFSEARSAFVLLRGEYHIYVGSDVRTADMVGGFIVEEETIVEQLTQNCAPRYPLLVCGKGGDARRARPSEKDLKGEILSRLPPEPSDRAERGILFNDVREGRASAQEFAAQLSDRELFALSRGALKMDSPLGASGNAGVMGGVTEELRARGVPCVTMTDGPSGVRLKKPSSLIPIGTLLSSAFDEALIEEVYTMLATEMSERGSHVLLAPALNLQRNPLGGRNFEYFSEDPLLAGKMAAAAVRGLKKGGASACPKHFACNNQEFNRNRNDSRLSERALRELYLYAFEICVKEGRPDFLMTSYNKVNGVYAHYNFELVRGILRGEWGFGGCVITDWWMKCAKSPEFCRVKNNAYRIRAGVNVLMPGGDYLGKRVQGGSPLRGLGKKEALTRGELLQNAAEILGTLAKLSYRGS